MAQGDQRVLLLICKTEGKIEELPFDTSKPYIQDGETKFDQRDNPWLNEAVKPHDQKGCLGLLTDVDTFFWHSPKGRESTIAQLKEQLLKGTGADGLAALQKDIYDIKDNFSQDAMRCFTLHNRPKGQCPDYRADNRKLMPNTSADRKAEGLGRYQSKTYLCDFCPVSIYNQTKNREAKGLYK